MTKTNALACVAFFDKAKAMIIERGYQWEIDNCQSFRLMDITPGTFALQYTFAVLSSSGLNNRVVQKLYDKFLESAKRGDENPFLSIANGRHRDAIMVVWALHSEILDIIKNKTTDDERIAYIRTLAQMGEKSSRHFARNIGIDCVKPDRWLLRLADQYGFDTPDELCQCIHKHRPEIRIGTIDVILWRYCNLTGEVE
jgi:hypothetical protein